ncbi:FAD-dependent oxidoreductase [Amycolatopsis pithecellobii]|nr:FAD-dependent oxidoreductase [Amycolatopsis pithecellobii]
MIPAQCDVAVVGAGPSGLMVATELALAGADVVVLERRGEPALPRAGTLASRVLEIFDSRGLADPVLTRAFELHEDPRATVGIWAGFHGVRFDRIDSTFPYVLMFAQMEVERILAARATELGARIVRLAAVTGLTQHDDHVRVEVEQTGGPATIEARYVVGADGANSTIRRAAGIGWHGQEADRTAVNVDAELDFPFPDPVTVTNDLNGWGLAYPLRKGVTRFGLIDAVASYEGRDVPVTLEQAKHMLRRIYGRDFGIESAKISRFHNAMFQAAAMRDRRVLLVGESVRVHYPASGVGMNFCLQDAFNLGWKLAATVRGWGAADLLDSYEAERRPEIERLLDDVRRQCAVQFEFSPEMLALKRMIEGELIPVPDVNRLLAENLSGISARYLPASPAAPPVVGRRLRDFVLDDGVPLFHRLREQRFLLLTTGERPDELPDQVRAEPLRRMPDSLTGFDAVLLRPDGHIAAAAAGSLDRAEIDRWFAKRA